MESAFIGSTAWYVFLLLGGIAVGVAIAMAMKAIGKD
jgi:hypothetical protein